jgi:hypothetical protein
MMILNKIHLIIVLLAVFFLSSCKKEQTTTINDKDALVFGHFFGMCQGETCIETFMLTSDKLYEDENDQYNWWEPFHFIELGNDKFELVKDLRNYFPQELLNDTNSIFGCPDCADQGGLLVMLSQNGDVKTWRIDQSKVAVPQYLLAFMDSVNVCIGLLSNE